MAVLPGFRIPNDSSSFADPQTELHEADLQMLALANDMTGVLSGCAVTAQGSPDQTVAVAAGIVVVGGVIAAVTSGNVSLAAADGTNPRYDLITVDNAGAKSKTDGTAAANPDKPDVPSGRAILAEIWRPASDNTVETDKIVDKRMMIRSGALPIEIGTTFPGSPYDNQHFDYEAGNGVVWRFRYNSGSANSNKWELVGGSPLAFVDDSVVGSLTSTTLVELGGGSLGTWVNPWAGDFLVTWGGMATNSAVGNYTYSNFTVGATVKDIYHGQVGQASHAGYYIGVSSRTWRFDAVAASQTFALKHKVSAGTGTVAYRFWSVLPVRVAG